MKLVHFLGLVVLGIISICGCGRSSGHTYVFDDVEAVIKDKPDSALRVLTSFDTTSFASEEERVCYYLLMADALYKAGYNDMLSEYVAPAVAYYKDHDTHKEAARAYFYSGLAKYNQQNYSSAAVDLLRSEKIAKEENDTMQLALIYKAMGDNFRYVNDLKSSLSYYQKSYECFVAIGDEEEAASVRVDIENNNTIDSIMANVDFKSTENRIRTLLKEGKLEEMLDSVFSLLANEENTMTSSLSSNIGAEVISYQQFEEELMAESYQRERLFWISIVVLSLLTVSLICVLIIKRNKTLRQERDAYMMAADDLSKNISAIEMRSNEKENLHTKEVRSLQSAIDDSKNTIRNLLVAQFSDLSELCQTYFLYDNHKNAQTKVYEKVRNLVSRVKSDVGFNNSLEDTINQSLDGLMSYFRKDFPNLNDWEYPLFMYNVCGMEPRVIALFLGERGELIYKRKANLKRKILQSELPRREEYLSFLS